MKIDALQTDAAILAELGRRLARRRIRLELTQAELARRAGVGKRTVERIEAGEAAQTNSIVRLLRALELLDALDGMLPDIEASPMEWLQREGRTRQRARSSREDEDEKDWRWDDDP